MTLFQGNVVSKLQLDSEGQTFLAYRFSTPIFGIPDIWAPNEWAKPVSRTFTKTSVSK